MKKAGKLSARKVLIVGEEELKARRAILRDMMSREQTPIDLDQIPERLAKEHLT
jgi:histidyl-tRNA synthetase